MEELCPFCEHELIAHAGYQTLPIGLSCSNRCGYSEQYHGMGDKVAWFQDKTFTLFDGVRYYSDYENFRKEIAKYRASK